MEKGNKEFNLSDKGTKDTTKKSLLESLNDSRHVMMNRSFKKGKGTKGDGNSYRPRQEIMPFFSTEMTPPLSQITVDLTNETKTKPDIEGVKWEEVDVVENEQQALPEPDSIDTD